MQPQYTPDFIARFWSRVEQTPTCWLWQGARTWGYGHTSFMYRSLRAHRVAWELTYGAIPAGSVVCHRCDNPPCCNPSHLWLGRQADNNADRATKGRGPDQRGARNPFAKLTVAQVAEIRQRAATGESQRAVALDLGVHQSTISRVARGLRWG